MAAGPAFCEPEELVGVPKLPLFAVPIKFAGATASEHAVRFGSTIKLSLGKEIVLSTPENLYLNAPPP